MSEKKKAEQFCTKSHQEAVVKKGCLSCAGGVWFGFGVFSVLVVAFGFIS